MTHRLSVGITTRDRAASLGRCLASLDLIAHLSPEVLVFDDGSAPPAVSDPAVHARRVRVIRDDTAPGYIAGRNRLVRESSAPLVLLMDDDAAVLDATAIDRGVALLDGDPRVAAVGFVQVDGRGRRWPAGDGGRPGPPVRYVPAYTGFAHLVRRDAFLALGGYRERFVFYGEEKELCLRLLDAGYRTVLLGDACVAHEPDPAGRSRQRYLRYVTRNDCLNAMYNQPIRDVLWMVPARMAMYFRMRRAWRISDPYGWWWVASDVLANAAPVLRDRRAVSATTRRLWRRLRDRAEPYIPPDPAGGRP
jgi:GT2 family glycosyltransferase